MKFTIVAFLVSPLLSTLVVAAFKLTSVGAIGVGFIIGAGLTLFGLIKDGKL